MKVIRWEIEGYKSIEQGSFPMDEFTILIGKNNSGKSNIIQSFQDFNNHHGNRSTRVGPSESWIRERATGKKEDRGFKISLRFELSNETHEEIINNIQQSKESTHKPPAEPPSPSEMSENGWLTEIAYKVHYKSDSSIEAVRYINYDGEDVKIDELTRARKVYGTDFRGTIDSAVNDYFESWQFVDPFREPQDVQNASFEIELRPDGSNLVQVLDSLERNHREIFQSVSDSYIKIMEGVSDLRIEYDPDATNARSVTIVVEEDKYETKFKSEDISSGSKEILVLLTQVFLSEKFADFLIIEEPELHVHPDAENEIYSILEEVANGDGPQIIVSTHSDVFVNQTDVSSIVRVEREGDTTLRTIQEGEIEHELAELGYDKSGLLQSEAVVFVEGRSDKRILKKFAKNLNFELDSEGVAIVELEGIENMKREAKSLVKLLYSFDIPYLFLCDKHDKTREQVQGELFDAMKRDDGNHWWSVSLDNIHVWDSYGIESYLLVPRAVATGLELSKEEVAQVIEDKQDIADKGKVLEDIYAKEHSDLDEPADVYAKDLQGMEIANSMEPTEISDEVVEVIAEIGRLITGWKQDKLAIPIEDKEGRD